MKPFPVVDASENTMCSNVSVRRGGAECQSLAATTSVPDDVVDSWETHVIRVPLEGC